MTTHPGYLAACLALFCAQATAQSTLHVPAEYASIQQAIDASADGDTVVVAPGTYYEQINFGTHQVIVRSSGGAALTTIDATYLGPVVSFNYGATRQAVIQGFTLTRGRSTFDAGGIVVNSGSPTILDNVITNNVGHGGGNGISLWLSSALVQGNLIANNDDDPSGSGGGGGGGIGILGNPCPVDNSCATEIRNNTIENNHVPRHLTGGGIFINSGGAVRIIDNIIRSNSAPSEGGGIGIIDSSSAQIENNLIVSNQVTDSSSQGGGVYWLTPDGDRGPFLIGNTLVNNLAAHGSAVYADGFDLSSRIINNMIVGADTLTAIECGNFASSAPIVMNNDAYVNGAAAYAGLCAGASGTDGNISQLPIFVAFDDFRLAPGSPGIDAGNNAFVTETTDLDGTHRIMDGNGDNVPTVDMGAYETDEIFRGDFE